MKTNKTSNQTETAKHNIPAGGPTPEKWWATLPPVERKLVQVIAGMMAGVTESKRVEIRRQGETIRARFIYLLSRPEPGCVSAIMLPEMPSGSCN